VKIDDLGDMQRRLVREQLLDAQSRWLDEAASEDSTPTLRAVAMIIADAFRTEAELYKSRGLAMGEFSSFFNETRDHSDHSGSAAADGSGAAEILPS